jgi:hypothetical protein
LDGGKATGLKPVPRMRKDAPVRQIGSLAFILAIAGCGSSSQNSLSNGHQPSAAPPAHTPSDGGDGTTNVPLTGPPTRLVPGSVSVVGLTSDGWAVFRDVDALRAANLSAPGDIQTISDRAGSIIIRGKVVFNWADVDWTTNMGALSVWTASGGAHTIGPTLYAEGLIAASEQGEAVVYTANTTVKTMDLVAASNDLSASQVLVKAMGRGSDTTCSPSIGFVGERLFVGSCSDGARAGNIQRFDNGAQGWQSTVVATGALPAWSADAAGERVFFQSENYSGQYAELGASHLIDTGVSSGVMLPDGSAVLYTVSDQLRRATLPDINPIPIVTTGFAQRAAFSPSFDVALYSTTVTYVDGTQRDLRLTRTDAFNPTPVEIVADPVAGLARSCMTTDGKFVLYLTDVTPSGANLHVSTVDGKERMVLPGVVEVAAGQGSIIVFTDNSSDPNQYPVVADLKALDLAKGVSPQLLEAKIVDGKAFQVDLSGIHVVYVRSGTDRDAAAADHDGMFVQTIH